MKLRKRDYVISYFLTVVFFAAMLNSPVQIQEIILLVIMSIVPALILGTITNFISLLIKALQIYIRKNS